MTQENSPPGGASHDVIKTIMEHYLVHYDVVRKKLGHAQDATDQSMESANTWDMKIIGQYNSAWTEIIEMFETCGITQEELFQIESILEKLPDNIRTHFERLIALDKKLQALMKTLEKFDFDGAMKKVEEVQLRPNPLSGLEREEYELAYSEADAVVKAFKFMP